jgi:hypothetical protein
VYSSRDSRLRSSQIALAIALMASVSWDLELDDNPSGVGTCWQCLEQRIEGSALHHARPIKQPEVLQEVRVLSKSTLHRLHQLLVCKVILGHYLPYRRVPGKDERRENRLCTTTPKFECLSACNSCRVPSVHLHQNAIVLPSPEKM